jgi:hypothetical protein
LGWEKDVKKCKNPTGTVHINAKKILQFIKHSFSILMNNANPNPASIVVDPGCSSRISHPINSIPDPGFRVKKVPDPGYRIRIHIHIKDLYF